MRGKAQPLAPFEQPYGALLDGLLEFRTLADAERTLVRLEQLRQLFAGSDDKKGEEYCRQVGRAGRRRSEGISRNPRVASRLRMQKREISDWFRIWLETPDVFTSWLQLRKRTDEYREIEAGERGDNDGVHTGESSGSDPG